MLGMHMGRVPAPSAREESGEIHRLDTYDWLQMINRASIVSNVEEGLLEKPPCSAHSDGVEYFARRSGKAECGSPWALHYF